MGAYVTSSRKVVLPGMAYRLESPYGSRPVFHSSAGVAYSVPNDTVTSWRTGTGVRDSTLDLPGGDDGPANLAGEFKAIKDTAYDEGSSPYATAYDNGHTFTAVSHAIAEDFVSGSAFCVDSTTGKVIGRYRGPLLPSIPSGSPTFEVTSAYTGTAGQTAIARTLPSNPTYSYAEIAGQTLLGSEIPRLFAELELTAKRFLSIGDDYLNLQFGWNQFISDIRSILESVVRLNQVKGTFLSGSGKISRRGYRFDPSISSTSELISGAGLVDFTNDPAFQGSGAFTQFPKNQLYQVNGIKTLSHLRTVSSKIWFKGAYTYYIDSGKSFWSRMDRHAQLAQHALGIELNPYTLWELAPWSWLVDWYTDLGSQIKSASLFADDNLVLRYGYLMITTSVTNAYSLASVLEAQGSSSRALPGIGVSFHTIQKERQRSTPYGFGKSVGSFTDFQWSILGALGLTKAWHVLRAV